MSIHINQFKCVGCGQCVEVCPGNLIKMETIPQTPCTQGEPGKLPHKAIIRREKDCWGCTSCIKECKFGAIDFFLGSDIGGKGSTLSVEQKGDIRIWTVKDLSGNAQTIEININESNKY